MDFEVVKERGLFGIRDVRIKELVVPCIYMKLENAVDEWKGFQNENTNCRQFLNYQLTNNEIQEFKEQLLKQVVI